MTLVVPRRQSSPQPIVMGSDPLTIELAAVDRARDPLLERTHKAITERKASIRPGRPATRQRTSKRLPELQARLTQLHERLGENAAGVTTARRADPTHAQHAAGTLGEDVHEAGVQLTEIERELGELLPPASPAPTPRTASG